MRCPRSTTIHNLQCLGNPTERFAAQLHSLKKLINISMNVCVGLYRGAGPGNAAGRRLSVPLPCFLDC